jgi:hypothetical protein
MHDQIRDVFLLIINYLILDLCSLCYHLPHFPVLVIKNGKNIPKPERPRSQSYPAILPTAIHPKAQRSYMGSILKASLLLLYFN